MANLAEKVRGALDFIFDRKMAFQLVFRSKVGWAAFRSPSGAIVLRDLAKFCRATSPPWGSTPEETARYVGRNEVWHRIIEQLNLSPEELFQLYTDNKYPVIKVEDNEA